MTTFENNTIISALGAYCESMLTIGKKARKNGNSEMAANCENQAETASKLILDFMGEKRA